MIDQIHACRCFIQQDQPRARAGSFLFARRRAIFGGNPRLVDDKDQFRIIKIDSAVESGLAALQDVGPVQLQCKCGLF